MAGKRETSRQHRLDKNRHLGGHHIVPGSRGGPREPWNMFRGIRGDPVWPPGKEAEKHVAWHTLFFNYLPSEAMVIIEHWKGKSGRLLRTTLSVKQRDAWDMLFGRETLPDIAIAWIERNFLPHEREFHGRTDLDTDQSDAS